MSHWLITINKEVFAGKVENLIDFVKLKPKRRMLVETLRKFGLYFDFENNLTVGSNMTVETMMEEINSVDLRYPIIVYKKSLFEYIIIDGNHRLEKSAKLGLKNIYAKFISKKELALINDNSVLEYLTNKGMFWIR